jgi:hypothetical protein
MKIVFNLKKAFNAIREAMGGPSLAYREQMEWYRIDEVEAGDPSWSKWIYGDKEQAIEPCQSLINAVADARNEYWRRKVGFMARYGVPQETADEFYKMYIGYHPTLGMAALHTGPYTASRSAWASAKRILGERNLELTPDNLLKVSESIQLPELPPGFDIMANENKSNPLVKETKRILRDKRGILEVRADIANKFNYFVKTYKRISREDMNKGVNIYLKKLIGQFGDMMTEDDIAFVVKSFPPEKTNQIEGKISGWVNTKINSIDEANPDMQKNILLGDGSFLTLNSKGMNKLLQKAATDGNWQDLYEQAIQMMATANKKSPEEMKKIVAEQEVFSDMFLEELRKIQDNLKKAGDIRADFLTVALGNKPKSPKIGAQQTSTNRYSKSTRALVELKMDILRTIVELGTDDPNKVADAINVSRKGFKTKAKAVYNGETMQKLIDTIRSEDQQAQKIKKKKQNRTYQEIYASTAKEQEQMINDEDLRDVGYTDLTTALKFASMSYVKSEAEWIDKKSKMKVLLISAPSIFTREGDSEAPVTSKILAELRETRQIEKGPEEPIRKALKAEMEKEIGKKNVPTQGGIEGNAALIGEEAVDDPNPEEPTSEMSDVVVPASEIPDDTTPTTPTVPASEIPQQEFGFDVTEMPSVPQEKTPQIPKKTPPKTPTPSIEPKDEEEEFDMKKLFGSTFKSLIVMARDLDSQGKVEASEEIHKIIRKYQGRI